MTAYGNMQTVHLTLCAEHAGSISSFCQTVIAPRRRNVYD
jgi:hypothetical protein